MNTVTTIVTKRKLYCLMRIPSRGGVLATRRMSSIVWRRPLLNVVQVVKIGSSAVAFVKGGGLEADLGALELVAARQALRNVDSAVDQRAQLWSVINHLETAEAGFAESSSNRGFFTEAVRSYAREVAVSNLFLVRCILVVCYVYLRENHLCRQTLDRMRAMLLAEAESVSGETAGALVHLFSGMLFVNNAVTKGHLLGDAEMKEYLHDLESFAKKNGV